RDALRPAGSGKEADLDLRQPDPGIRVIGSDPMMASKAKLETPAEGGAVDRRHPRLAAGFQASIELRQLAALIEEQRGGGLLATRPCHLGKLSAQGFQQAEVGACTKCVLG